MANKPNFNASTKDVLKALALDSAKTLFRRRDDYKDNRSQHLEKFLLHGVHFRRRSPHSSQLVWDLEATLRAWDAALELAFAGSRK